MRATVGRLGWLLVVWLALWESITVANVLSGLIAGVVILALFPPGSARPAAVHPRAAIRFLGFFLWRLLEASAVVAWEVITPTNKIKEGVVAVPMHTTSETVITVVANALSLVPGTLTIEVWHDPPTLYVHVLHLHDIEEVRREIHRLEHLAVEALGDDTARAAVRTEDALSENGDQS